MLPGCQEKTRLGSGRLSGMIIRLVNQPATARPISTTAEIHQCSWPNAPVTSGDESQLPSTVPTVDGGDRRQARACRWPTEIFLDWSISGMLPSLAGPNSAACEPTSATTTEHQIDVADHDRQHGKRHDERSSATLQATITVRLLKRSAR